MPHVETQFYYPVLDGLGLLDQNLARSEMRKCNLKHPAQRQFQDLQGEYRRMIQGSPGHREYLSQLVA